MKPISRIDHIKKNIKRINVMKAKKNVQIQKIQKIQKNKRGFGPKTNYLIGTILITAGLLIFVIYFFDWGVLPEISNLPNSLEPEEANSSSLPVKEETSETKALKEPEISGFKGSESFFKEPEENDFFFPNTRDLINDRIVEETSNNLGEKISEIEKKMIELDTKIVKTSNNLEKKIIKTSDTILDLVVEGDNSIGEKVVEISNKINDKMIELNTKIGAIDTKIEAIDTKTIEISNNLGDMVVESHTKINDKMIELDTKIIETSDTILDLVVEGDNSIREKVVEISNKINDKMIELNNNVIEVSDALEKKITDVNNRVYEVNESIIEVNNNVTEKINDLQNKLVVDSDELNKLDEVIKDVRRLYQPKPDLPAAPTAQDELNKLDKIVEDVRRLYQPKPDLPAAAPIDVQEELPEATELAPLSQELIDFIHQDLPNSSSSSSNLPIIPLQDEGSLAESMNRRTEELIEQGTPEEVAAGDALWDYSDNRRQEQLIEDIWGLPDAGSSNSSIDSGTPDVPETEPPVVGESAPDRAETPTTIESVQVQDLPEAAQTIDVQNPSASEERGR